MVLLKIVYLLVRRLLGLVVLLLRKDMTKDADLVLPSGKRPGQRADHARAAGSYWIRPVRRRISAFSFRQACNLVKNLGEQFEDIKYLLRDC